MRREPTTCYVLLGEEEAKGSSLGNDRTRVIMAHNVFGPYHNIVSSLDSLVFRPPNGIFLDYLFDECLGLLSYTGFRRKGPYGVIC